MTKQADIAVIGMAVMGRNLALNMAEKGFTVAIYNRTVERVDEVIAEAGPLAERLIPCRALEHLRDLVKPARPILMMVKAGPAVDETIETLAPHLDAGDILIDAGNANFRDTVRREKHVRSLGLQFLGIGVSGGEEGARHGPSIMSGGAREAYDRIAPVLTAISARFQGTPCSAYMGPDGAGHFVKTIHNGIEYADMQMIAEIYGLLRYGHGLAPAAIADVFERWSSGPLDSYLIEITARALRATDAETGGPLVDVIVDSAGQKGTGRWSAIEALDLGVPASAIVAAVDARGISALRALRAKIVARFGAEPASRGTATDAVIADYEKALIGGKILAYAQGFSVLNAASAEHKWNLPLAEVARIWRAGCIIRSAFLDRIAAAYDRTADLETILLDPGLSDLMADCLPAMRKVVGEAALEGRPLPALSAGLAYLHALAQARTTADLTQAQRDIFGAHGFERTDKPGSFHGAW
ncbi:NADP-dependent phosphogluconate dehydrogenase [Prosthecomicrobium pneumaticum]|uniref:6-phosphogluconate dehydrogenase, decarboxylating n=1 Tax=Prosthecomicrobium pneumaticum TaxID=81895 RepID=A0A7W9FKI9_9HYPH|nr:NADP-dependent phosphogluconate dehydrogenase [Prosthecomicrobium pneumaticum]MBB5752726.1 6-phosphogluconate dehydrogenase [Prosthecomicrobium pneumaticum]